MSTMDQEEATTILEIMMTADGGKAAIAYDLTLQFIEEFPEYSDLAKDVFDGIYGNYESFDQISARIG